MAGEMAEKSKECKGYKDEQEEKSKKWDTKQAAEAVATLEKKKATLLKIQASRLKKAAMRASRASIVRSHPYSLSFLITISQPSALLSLSSTTTSWL
jgi:hypothetical protein